MAVLEFWTQVKSYGTIGITKYFLLYFIAIFWQYYYILPEFLSYETRIFGTIVQLDLLSSVCVADSSFPDGAIMVF